MALLKFRLLSVATILAGVLLAFDRHPARAELNAWTPLGPDGGNVYDLAADPDNPDQAYALTQSGLSKTTDGGATWRPLGVGGYAFAVDPRRHETVYIGARDRNDYFATVRKSVDGGLTWSDPVTVGRDRVMGLAIDRDSGALYAVTEAGQVSTSLDAGATWTAVTVDEYWLDGPIAVGGDGAVYVATRFGISKSSDLGATWSSVLDLREGFYALVADNQAPETVYAVATDSGVLRTRNGGETWDSANAGLPNLVAWSLAADPHVAGTLYLGHANGVFKTTDSGSEWKQTGLESNSIYAVAVGSNGTRIYAAPEGIGVFRSTDGGGAWVTSGSGLGRAGATVVVDPARSTTVYATANGVFKSLDGGQNWTLSARGLNDKVNALAFDPSTLGTLYAGTCVGISRSRDGGMTWEPTGLAYSAARSPWNDCVSSIAVDPVNPAIVYAGKRGNGILKTVDGGKTWRDVSMRLKNREIESLLIDPHAPQTLYARALVWSAHRCGLYKTTDGGRRWRPICPPEKADVQSLALDPSKPATLYAGLYYPYGDPSPSGVYKSTNGGRTWEPTALVDFYSLRVTALGVDPGSPQTIFAATDEGVFVSDDHGTSWLPLTDGLGGRFGIGVQNFAFSPTAKGTVYAGTFEGVYTIERADRCHGDCSRDGVVTVDELVRGVKIALGIAGVDACNPFDRDGNGAIEIDELVAGIGDALNGCIVTPGPVYRAPRTYETVGLPTQMFVEDFDRDGNPDVLILGDEAFSLLMANGDGSFARQQSFVRTEGLHDAAVVDLNGDTVLDLVFVVSSELLPGYVVVLLGRGDGTFVTAERYALNAYWYGSLLVGDLNGDSVPDLVVMDQTRDVLVSLGLGDGSFAPARRFDSGGCTPCDCPYLSSVKDVDGDGNTDVVTTMRVLFGDSNGTLRLAEDRGDSSGAEAADSDRSGGVGNAPRSAPGGGAMACLRADFGSAAFSDYPGGGRTVVTTSADLNGDGAADVVAGMVNPSRISVSLSIGNGSFVAPDFLPLDVAPAIIAVADLNLDGTLDILSAGDCRLWYTEVCEISQTGSLTVWLGDR